MAASRAEISIRVRRAIVFLAITGFGLWLMIRFLDLGAYEWIKVLHIVAVISWMAGMLYLPRLFVYHCGVAKGGEASETFKVMERKLLRYITNPAMVVAWIAGLWISWRVYDFQGQWLWAKLALVLGLSAVHGYFAKAVADFARDEGNRDHRHWRFLNEAPTLLMIFIVILVIVKPTLF